MSILKRQKWQKRSSQRQNWVFKGAQKPFLGINGTLLAALDGSEFFSSYNIKYENCLTKSSSKTGTTRYYDNALTPAVVALNNPNIIPFTPEFITSQEGSTGGNGLTARFNAPRGIILYAIQSRRTDYAGLRSARESDK